MPRLTRKHFRMYASWLKDINLSYFPDCESVLGYARNQQPHTGHKKWDKELLEGIFENTCTPTQMKQRIVRVVQNQLCCTNDSFRPSQFRTAAGWDLLTSKTKES